MKNYLKVRLNKTWLLTFIGANFVEIAERVSNNSRCGTVRTSYMLVGILVPA